MEAGIKSAEGLGGKVERDENGEKGLREKTFLHTPSPPYLFSELDHKSLTACVY